MRIKRTMIYAAVLVIVVIVLAMQSGGGVLDFFAYDCKQAAEAMGLNWMWHPIKGCFVQQPGGNWIPIDSQRIINP